MKSACQSSKVSDHYLDAKTTMNVQDVTHSDEEDIPSDEIGNQSIPFK